MTVKLKLIKPIEAHNELMEELEFKEPNAGDIAKCGMPMAIYTTPDEPDIEKMELKPMAILGYIVRLTGIPKSSAMTMCTRDYMGAQNIIISFFGGPTPNITDK